MCPALTKKIYPPCVLWRIVCGVRSTANNTQSPPQAVYALWRFSHAKSGDSPACTIERNRYDYCQQLLHHSEKKTGEEVRLNPIIQKVSIDLLEIQYIKIRNCDHPICCPVCDLQMIIKDSTRRYIKDESGRKLPFNLRRFYCANCDRIHTEIPDMVTPYCQYDNATRERVKSGECATFAGDDSTIQKWRKK